MLALAHHLQRAIDKGLVADRAAVARKLGLTRARVTQLLDLLLLAPDLQLQVLKLEAVDGIEPTSERPLRRIAHEAVWTSQRTEFSNLTTLGREGESTSSP
jgi:ParB-like chromosome segregation protein Spo0J